MNYGYQADMQGDMGAINRYAQHLADLQNPALQPLWQHIWAQKAMCLRSLHDGGMGMGMGTGTGPTGRSPWRVDRSGEGAWGPTGPGMVPMPSQASMGTMSGAEEPPAAEVPPYRFQPGAGVVPIEAYVPEHRGRVGRVMQVVSDQFFYSVDFGAGYPHMWYAESDLDPAPDGFETGQEVGE